MGEGVGDGTSEIDETEANRNSCSSRRWMKSLEQRMKGKEERARFSRQIINIYSGSMRPPIFGVW